MDNKERTVPSWNFLETVEANVGNKKLSDKEFREFVENSLPIVQYKQDMLPGDIYEQWMSESVNTTIGGLPLSSFSDKDMRAIAGHAIDALANFSLRVVERNNKINDKIDDLMKPLRLEMQGKGGV